jgi:hypothetical protein
MVLDYVDEFELVSDDAGEERTVLCCDISSIPALAPNFAFFPFLEHAGDATRLVGPTSRF